MLNSKSKPRQKILYGAGRMGERALIYYGINNVYAFADNFRHGHTYLGKSVLSVSELNDIKNYYDIVICIEDTKSAVATLEDSGITNCSVWRPLEDIRAYETTLTPTYIELRNSHVLAKTLDFIKHPEYINDYMSDIIKANKTNAQKNDKISFQRRLLSENFAYGYFEELKSFAERSNKFYEAPILNHGVTFENLRPLGRLPNLIEIGINMKPIMHAQSKDCLVFSVGQYLHYAEQFYNENDYKQYKNQLGRNLLVFPMHTIPLWSSSYDFRAFVDYCMEQGKNFDSITVCAYFYDFNSKVIDLFRAEGANIVSAGMLYDPHFARRLKTIISVSDAVVTNVIGTHVFFCLGLCKPVKTYIQEYVSHSSEIYDVDAFITSGQMLQDKLMHTLSSHEWTITKQQLDVFEPYGGFSQYKTKEEMGAIFDLSKRILENCDYRYSNYAESIKYTYQLLRQSNLENDKIQFKLMNEALPMKL